MKHLAVIPARSSSKGVPNKNMQKLFGIPLLSWAIICAKEAQIFDSIVLSTDSELYANEGAKWNAEIPFLREPKLSDDKSSINDALLDLLSKMDTVYDTLTLLEPTAPLRSPMLINKCLNTLLETNSNSVFTTLKLDRKYHPLKQFFIQDDNTIRHYLAKGQEIVNRQELDNTYVKSGLVYSIKVESFLKHKMIIHGKSTGVVHKDTKINIDNFSDLRLMRDFEEIGNPLEYMKKYLGT